MDQRIDDGLDSFIHADHPQRSKASQCSKCSNEFDICLDKILQQPIQDRSQHDDEIKNIPRILQERAFSPVKAHDDDFKRRFNNKNDRNNSKHQLNGLLLILIGQFRSIKSQKQGIKSNHMVNEIIKVLILHHSLQEDPEAIITCKEEQRFARFIDFYILLP